MLARESLLSAATVMNMMDTFYPLYCTFLKNPQEGYQSLLEYYQTFSHMRANKVPLLTNLFSTDVKGRSFMNICNTVWTQIFSRPSDMDQAIRKAINNPLTVRHDSCLLYTSPSPRDTR